MSTELLNVEELNDEASLQSKQFYAIIFFANIILNVDQGIMPGATNIMMNYFNLNQAWFGFLGSSIYFGLIAGSFVAGIIFQKYNAKKIILFSIIGLCVSLGVLTLTKIYTILILSRIAVGIFQVFLVVYFPVWVDLHGKNLKTIWMTFLQLGVPLGLYFGYSMTNLITNYYCWKWSIWGNIILFIPFFLIFLFWKEKSVSITIHQPLRKIERKISLYLDDDNIFTPKNLSRNTSLMKEKPKKLTRKESIKAHVYESYASQHKSLISNKIFVGSMLSISCIYFVVSGLLFWSSNYFENVLNIDKSVVFLSYGFLAITSPTLGVTFGGFICHKLGGYTNPSALLLCMIFAFLGFICGAPVPFLSNFTVVFLLLWLLMFFGSSFLPIITGVMLNSVEQSAKSFANSSAQTYYNLLGFLPAPFLYGMINSLTKVKKARWGMVLLMYWGIFGVFSITFAFISDRRVRKEFELKEELNFFLENEDEDDEKKNDKI